MPRPRDDPARRRERAPAEPPNARTLAARVHAVRAVLRERAEAGRRHGLEHPGRLRTR